MRTLHTVNKSPFEKSSLASCIRLMQPGSTVLLIEDAVFAAQAEVVIRPALDKGRVFCLEPDYVARGLDSSQPVEGIELVDYEGFVALAVEHDRVQAWL